MANVTPQVSGKVKAGTLASTVASGLVSALLVFTGAHVPVLEPLATNPLVVLGLVAFVTGLFTFAAGYIARHLPAELVKDVSTAVNELNLADFEVPAPAEPEPLLNEDGTPKTDPARS